MDNCALLLWKSDDACDRMSRCGRQADEAKFAMKRKRSWERWQKIGQFRRQIVGSQAMSGRRRRWNRLEEVDEEGEEEEELGHGWPCCC
jgi:hypothetical protein